MASVRAIPHGRVSVALFHPNMKLLALFAAALTASLALPGRALADPMSTTTVYFVAGEEGGPYRTNTFAGLTSATSYTYNYPVDNPSDTAYAAATVTDANPGGGYRHGTRSPCVRHRDEHHHRVELPRYRVYGRGQLFRYAWLFFLPG